MATQDGSQEAQASLPTGALPHVHFFISRSTATLQAVIEQNTRTHAPALLGTYFEGTLGYRLAAVISELDSNHEDSGMAPAVVSCTEQEFNSWVIPRQLLENEDLARPRSFSDAYIGVHRERYDAGLDSILDKAFVGTLVYSGGPTDYAIHVEAFIGSEDLNPRNAATLSQYEALHSRDDTTVRFDVRSDVSVISALFRGAQYSQVVEGAEASVLDHPANLRIPILKQRCMRIPGWLVSDSRSPGETEGTRIACRARVYITPRRLEPSAVATED